HYAGGTFLAQDADEDVSIFEVRCHVHVTNANDGGVKADLPRDDCAELAFDELVNAKQSMFHKGRASFQLAISRLASWKLALQFLCDLLELITFDHVADLVLVKVAQLQA